MTSKEQARIRALVQKATRPEKVVPLVLRADIQARIEELELRLIDIRKEADTLAGNPAASEVAGQIEDLIKESEDATIKVTIRGLPRKAWSDLKTKYPHKDPRTYLYDVAIFDEAVPACWVSPDIDEDTRGKLLEELTDGQWEHLCQAVQAVNGDVTVPFSALATLARRDSGASEPQPEPTE